MKNVIAKLLFFTFLTPIYDALDNAQCCGALFIDIMKAFDMVNHIILLHILELLGLRGFVLRYFESYLTDRYQFVVANGMFSNMLSISKGILQGSVFAQFCF